MTGSAFSFVHCSDLHLDSPFVGVGTIAPAIAEALKDATFKAFDRVVDLAIERQTDFIIIAGDVYDGENRSLRAQLKFRDGLARACTAGIRCFVAHGNHDPLNGWEAALSIPTGAVRFGAQSVEKHTVERNGVPLAAVYGVSYAARDIKTNLAAQFHRDSDGLYSIGVLHCNVGGRPEHDNYAPCTLDDLCGAGMNYWALGHIHTQMVLRETAPRVVYPGNTQGRSVKETGTRGCEIVSVGASGNAQVEQVETDAIRWSNREISIEHLTTVDDLIDQIAATKEAERAAAGGRAVVMGLTLAGRGELHTQLIHAGVVDDLAQRLRDGEDERADFVWVHSMEAETGTPVNIAERREVPDFVGEYLKTADGMRRAADAAKKLREILSAAPNFNEVRTSVARMTNDEILHSLQEAETYGLDLLLREPE